MQDAVTLPNEIVVIIIRHTYRPFPYGLVCRDWYDIAVEEAGRRARDFVRATIWAPAWRADACVSSTWLYLAVCARGIDMFHISSGVRGLLLTNILAHLSAPCIPLVHREVIMEKVSQVAFASGIDAQSAKALLTYTSGNTWCRNLIAVEAAGIDPEVTRRTGKFNLLYADSKYADKVMAICAKYSL